MYLCLVHSVGSEVAGPLLRCREQGGDAIRISQQELHIMATSNRSLPVRPFSQITEQSVGWLWRGRLPVGKLTILDGDPGLGKTLLTLDFCARVTTGKPFPGARPAVGPLNGLFLTA